MHQGPYLLLESAIYVQFDKSYYVDHSFNNLVGIQKEDRQVSEQYLLFLDKLLYRQLHG